mgnify:CR=1 FL=1
MATTSPSPLYKEESYRTLRNRWLRRYLLTEDKSLSAIRGILFDASQDAFKQINELETKSNISSKVRSAQLSAFMGVVRDINKSTFKSVGSVIRDGQKDSAAAAVDALLEHEKAVLKRIFKTTDAVEDWGAIQRASAEASVQHVISRYLRTTIPLSRRVYRSNALSNGYIERAINSSIATGASAKDIAERVRSSILPSTPGGVSYAAMRLGRTELNNAFHATTIAQSENRPWIDYLQWNLSKLHDQKTGCKCEEYAELKFFSVGQTPRKPHPQCRCFTTPVLMDWHIFEQNLLSGMFNDYIAA